MLRTGEEYQVPRQEDHVHLCVMDMEDFVYDYQSDLDFI